MMNLHVKAVSAAALCAIVSISTGVLAQPPINKHPAKAKPTAPLQQSTVVATFTNSSALAVAPKKPVVVTAVAPKGPIPSDKHAIIFVGGKTQSSGDSALNPQPIPPGHIAPGDPVR
jgi:hypothetical protein